MSQSENIFALEQTHNKNRWYLKVEPNISVGPPDKKFLFGGVGLASSIVAMEGVTGRRIIWATAQYLSFARLGEIVDLDVKVPVSGNSISQARVIGHVGDREIFTVNGALGQRDLLHSGQWAQMPEAASPDECPPVPGWTERNDLHTNLDTRLAKGRDGEERNTGVPSEDAQVLMWVRMKNGLPMNASALAIIADFVPSASGNALGIHAGANSLDNTLRVSRLVPTQWVLCDIRIHAIQGGFVHGRMLIFAETGELMATASQSAIVRIWGA